MNAERCRKLINCHTHPHVTEWVRDIPDKESYLNITRILYKAGYRLHHSSQAPNRGITNVNMHNSNYGIVLEYSGQFGTGYQVHIKSDGSCKNCNHICAYYVMEVSDEQI